MNRISLGSVLVVLGLFWAAAVWAYPGGYTGGTNKSGGSGCGGCHKGTSQSMVAISGPSTLKAGQTGTYTLTIDTGTLIGCDIAASSGAVNGSGASLKVSNSEVTHSKKLTGTSVSFTYTPSASGNAMLYAVGAKNSKEGGWGHAPNFTVTVTADGTTDVDDNEQRKPAAYVLHQNYPNPFNPSTVIRYDLPQEGTVRLVVFNLLGEEVVTLVDGTRAAGMHAVRFDGTRLASGAYLYRLEVHPSTHGAPFTATRKFVLAR